jgi:tetratricopeptide (TPR) repeat protein
MTVAGLVLAGLLAIPAWRRIDEWRRVEAGQSALARGDFVQAVSALQSAAKAYPSSGRAEFLLAVVYRRLGDYSRFQEHAARAKRLGWPAADLELQELLAFTQSGFADEQTDEALNKLIERGADDWTAEQIYEARARGHLAVYRLSEADMALDFWLQWRPDSVSARFLRAQVAERMNDKGRMVEEYRRIVEVAPENLEARLRYAGALHSNDEIDAAVQEFRRCVAMAPDDIRSQVGLADSLFRQSGITPELEELVAKLMKASLETPHRVRVLGIAARICQTQGKHDQVIDFMKEVTQIAPYDIAAYQLLTAACFATNRREEAMRYRQVAQDKRRRADRLTDLAYAIQQQPRNADLRYEHGLLIQEEGFDDDAATWWLTALNCDPLHQASHEALAKYYHDKGNLERMRLHQRGAEKSAEKTFEIAWQAMVDGDLAAAGKKLEMMAKYRSLRHHVALLASALAVKEAFARQVPPDRETVQLLMDLTSHPQLQTRALTVLGGAWYQLKSFGPAQEALLHALSKDNRNVDAHRWLAALYFDTGATRHAQAHLLQVTKLAPNDHRPFRLLGLIHKDTELWSKAIDAYQASLERNPHQSDREAVLQELAECQIKSRKYEDALETLAEAAPSNDVKVLKAECFVAMSRSDEALAVLKDVLTAEPDHPRANAARADLALIAKDLDLAEQCLKRVVENLPYNDIAWLKLSQVYSRKKQAREAKEAGDRALELRRLQRQYVDLMERAIKEPGDRSIRQELQAVARAIGRNDLAEHWKEIVDAMAPQVPAAPPASPVAAPAFKPLVTPASPSAPSDAPIPQKAAGRRQEAESLPASSTPKGP